MLSITKTMSLQQLTDQFLSVSPAPPCSPSLINYLSVCRWIWSSLKPSPTVPRTWSPSCYATAPRTASHCRVSLITHGCAPTPAESCPPSALASPELLPAAFPRRAVFICPPQETWPACLGSLPWASNCHYSGTFYDGYDCVPTFFIIVQCDVIVSGMFWLILFFLCVCVCVFIAISSLAPFSCFTDTVVIWDFCSGWSWSQSTTVKLSKVTVFSNSLRWESRSGFKFPQAVPLISNKYYKMICGHLMSDYVTIGVIK